MIPSTVYGTPSMKDGRIAVEPRYAEPGGGCRAEQGYVFCPRGVEGVVHSADR